MEISFPGWGGGGGFGLVDNVANQLSLPEAWVKLGNNLPCFQLRRCRFEHKSSLHSYSGSGAAKAPGDIYVLSKLGSYTLLFNTGKAFSTCMHTQIILIHF